MNISRRYIVQSGAVLVITVYLLFGELYGRSETLVSHYLQLREKQQAVLTTEEFINRKRVLQIQKDELTKLVQSTYSSTRQASGGLFEYLTMNAKASNVIVRAIIPAEAKNSGGAKDIPFTITVSGKYHDAGKFINCIENGAIPIVIIQSQFGSDPIGNPILDVVIEGRAHILAET